MTVADVLLLASSPAVPGGVSPPAFLKCPPPHRPRFPGPTPFPCHLSAQKNFSWIRSILKRFHPSYKRCVYCMYISSPLPQEPTPCHLFSSRNPSLFCSKNQSVNCTPFTPTPPWFHLPNKYYTWVSLKVRIFLVTILHPRKGLRKLATGELMPATAGL